MISNDDTSTNGKCFIKSSGSKGSTCTVRIGSGSLPVYQMVVGCLGLLNNLLVLIAVVIGIYCGKASEIPDSHLPTTQALIIEVKHLRSLQTETIKEQDEVLRALKEVQGTSQQLKLHLKQNLTHSDNLEGQLQTLQLERAVLQSDTFHIRESCGRCLSGWFLFNTSCYFHSKTASSLMKNWRDSMADCMSRGANLTVIDNLEEQLTLFEYLPKLDPNIWSRRSKPGGIWIGLSEIKTKGNWVWINNVTQQDDGYWIEGEPNNYGPQGEDCAAFMNRKNPRETWFDANCMEKKEWLCEKEPN